MKCLSTFFRSSQRNVARPAVKIMKNISLGLRSIIHSNVGQVMFKTRPCLSVGVRTADLHMHTVASDGTDTVEERVDQALEKGIDCIAITDHDTIPGELDEPVQERRGVEVITGSEIKCEVEGSKIEILGYFINPEAEGAGEIFRRLEENRNSRMERMVRKLNEEIEEDVRLEDVRDQAEGSIGRPHLAKALVQKGVVGSVEEAFENLIGSDHKAYVETPKISAEEVINLVHDTGGVASLAHPGRSLSEDEAWEKVKKLREAGLDAIEVDYTYQQKIRRDSYKVYFTEEMAEEIAEDLNLIKTGGTDCHGSRSDKFNIGKVTVPYSKVERLKSKTGDL